MPSSMTLAAAGPDDEDDSSAKRGVYLCTGACDIEIGSGPGVKAETDDAVAAIAIAMWWFFILLCDVRLSYALNDQERQ